jgi:transcriptional regulator with XRE-family HTH domain
MTDTPFAERLRAAMGARRVTMAALGAECGVTAQAVHKWTSGKAMPSSAQFMAICRMLGVSHEWLFAPDFMDWESAERAPQGRHAKYWVREAVAELKEQGIL